MATVTCLLDGRTFTQDKALKAHLKSVHPSGLLVVKIGDRVEVPYGMGREGSGVILEKAADSSCGCLNNSDPAALPIHRNCGCQPPDGWDIYIKGLERPEAMTTSDWKKFNTFLREQS